MGLNTDLDEAARVAMREMIDYLVSERGLTRNKAYSLCSQAVDLRVTPRVLPTTSVSRTRWRPQRVADPRDVARLWARPACRPRPAR